ncbi:MAG: DUF1801 domain-containing protein [Fimbriimonadaceae bacterium]|nr:DUF1801 domain-containing protein [Fimbriimonadaceae bacterium]
MDTERQVEALLASQGEPKQSELRRLHALFRAVAPSAKLWFHDGRDESGKVVANPSVGYGSYLIRYADGKTKEFYRVGLSPNKTGVSVYVLGLDDKTYLARTYGASLGKASVTGYCIKFKSTEDIDLDVLEAAVRHGLSLPSQPT